VELLQGAGERDLVATCGEQRPLLAGGGLDGLFQPKGLCDSAVVHGLAPQGLVANELDEPGGGRRLARVGNSRQVELQALERDAELVSVAVRDSFAYVFALQPGSQLPRADLDALRLRLLRDGSGDPDALSPLAEQRDDLPTGDAADSFGGTGCRGCCRCRGQRIHHCCSFAVDSHPS
jgi:hypothetical protein